MRAGELGVAVVPIEGKDDDPLRAFHDCPEQSGLLLRECLGLSQRRFRPLAVAGIPGHGGIPDDFADAVLDGRDGDREMDRLAIFGPPKRLVIQQQSFVLLLPVQRNQLLEGIPDHLACRVTEQPFRSRVPASDDALPVLADDGIL